MISSSLSNYLTVGFWVTLVEADGSSNDAPCFEDSKFYRNPNTLAHSVWSPNECAKYYLCLGES